MEGRRIPGVTLTGYGGARSDRALKRHRAHAVATHLKGREVDARLRSTHD